MALHELGQLAEASPDETEEIVLPNLTLRFAGMREQEQPDGRVLRWFGFNVIDPIKGEIMSGQTIDGMQPVVISSAPMVFKKKFVRRDGIINIGSKGGPR